MRKIKKIWILVLVKRGFIEEPEIFFKMSNAQNRRKELMSCFNPDYDEIDIFEKEINLDNAFQGKDEDKHWKTGIML